MEDIDAGLDPLIKALPLNEKVSVVALKTYYD